MPPTTFKERVADTALQAGERLLRVIDKWIARQSEVATTPFLPLETFSWIPELEANWKTIRAELDDLMQWRVDLPNFQELQPDQGYLASGDDWKTFFFMGYGYRADSNCARCPETARLLDRIPGLTTAMFSILAPGAHLDAHRGPYKGVIRYHLGLVVPDPPASCGITVAGETRHWTEGGSLLLDDSMEHEAWNNSSEHRVILFCDIVRPLRQPAAAFNKAVIKVIGATPYIGNAKKRHQEWEERFAAAHGDPPPLSQNQYP